VTAASLALVGHHAVESVVVPHVLADVVLDETTARLAGMLEPSFLDEAGWNPATRVLSLRAQHLLLGRTVCRVHLCRNTIRPGLTVCYGCFMRLTRQGMSPEEIGAASELSVAPTVATRCAVPGCGCAPTMRHAVLCEPHARKFRLRRPRISLEKFLTDPRVRPQPPMPTCQVAACTRAADAARGYCNTHYQRWRNAQATDPELDPQQWQARESPVAEPGQVNLRALPVLVVVEVLFGVQQRVRGGA
jgi:hypothetical protein